MKEIMNESKNIFLNLLFFTDWKMKLLDVEVNLVWFILSFFAFYMLIFTFLINILTPFTPKLLSDIFGYGESISCLFRRKNCYLS